MEKSLPATPPIFSRSTALSSSSKPAPQDHRIRFELGTETLLTTSLPLYLSRQEAAAHTPQPLSPSSSCHYASYPCPHRTTHAKASSTSCNLSSSFTRNQLTLSYSSPQQNPAATTHKNGRSNPHRGPSSSNDSL